MNKKRALGLRIKEIRKSQNLTQEQLAELISVEPTTISNMECGRNYPNLATLEKALDALNSNFSEIFDFEHIKDKNIILKDITNFINNADEKEIQFLYKVIKNIIQFKNAK